MSGRIDGDVVHVAGHGRDRERRRGGAVVGGRYRPLDHVIGAVVVEVLALRVVALRL